MPAIAKTQASDADIDSYLHTKVPAHRHAEARALVKLFEQETGFRAVIWGAMIGFGRYEYTYQSGHSGESLATGFAFRKTDISIYGLAGFDGLEAPLQTLGKHRLGKSCLYIKSVDTVNQDALRAIIRGGLTALAKRWPVTSA
ncbi:MAG: DUF1801 domain-containing protein [Microgenomates group bacterium]